MVDATAMRSRPGRPRKIPIGTEADPTEQIVGAATRLFASRGVAATTMAEIAAFARYWADRDRLVGAVERVVADGVASGELRNVDARLAALTLLANDEATQNWFRAGRSGPDHLAAFVADLALRGLLADPSELDRVRAEAAGC